MRLQNPGVRWGIGISGAAAIAAIAFLVFDGTMRNVLLLIAVVDLFTTPWILKQAA